MFDEKTVQGLKYYVYILVDPRNQRPFYVGKGKGNRLFEHLECAIKDLETTNLKYELIRAIKNCDMQPSHIIVRHGLKEEEAFHVEAALIDFSDYCKIDTTNIAGGHNSIEKGLMTAVEIKSFYNAEPLRSIANDCVIININKSYRRGNAADAIYLATKETWTIDSRNLERIKYVLSEYHGLIVEVFNVQEWYKKERGFGSSAKQFGKTKIGYGFNGTIAPEEVRKQYIGKSIAHAKKKGNANVVRYSL